MTAGEIVIASPPKAGVAISNEIASLSLAMTAGEIVIASLP